MMHEKNAPVISPSSSTDSLKASRDGYHSLIELDSSMMTNPNRLSTEHYPVFPVIEWGNDVEEDENDDKSCNSIHHHFSSIDSSIESSIGFRPYKRKRSQEHDILHHSRSYKSRLNELGSDSLRAHDSIMDMPIMYYGPASEALDGKKRKTSDNHKMLSKCLNRIENISEPSSFNISLDGYEELSRGVKKLERLMQQDSNDRCKLLAFCSN